MLKRGCKGSSPAHHDPKGGRSGPDRRQWARAGIQPVTISSGRTRKVGPHPHPK
ncbi:hypothetical protein BCR44DRAFT_36869 [Catenaria anguillulae PL171]|uniref:Uncharacterized protein n=1 Tax=Catenaria anguillulae PL171 TaxID=765915 RepID=A0A1Y2HCE6_9FUNG|nr:hypothetical protein BCR44DRAFT_36869 [Catenaria anguillulae PL171]